MRAVRTEPVKRPPATLPPDHARASLVEGLESRTLFAAAQPAFAEVVFVRAAAAGVPAAAQFATAQLTTAQLARFLTAPQMDRDAATLTGASVQFRWQADGTAERVPPPGRFRLVPPPPTSSAAKDASPADRPDAQQPPRQAIVDRDDTDDRSAAPPVAGALADRQPHPIGDARPDEGEPAAAATSLPTSVMVTPVMIAAADESVGPSTSVDAGVVVWSGGEATLTPSAASAEAAAASRAAGTVAAGTARLVESAAMAIAAGWAGMSSAVSASVAGVTTAMGELTGVTSTVADAGAPRGGVASGVAAGVGAAVAAYWLVATPAARDEKAEERARAAKRGLWSLTPIEL